jgi:alpha-1,3-fucosyltransferase
VTQLSCPFLADRCHITNDIRRFSRADAVVFHMRDKINHRLARRKRRPRQRFVFTLWESPIHTPNLDSYKRFFNWTMTYRSHSHVIASYYWSNTYIHRSSQYYQHMIQVNTTQQLNIRFRTIAHRLSDDVLAKKTVGTVAALISNCGGQSQRLLLIRNLKRYIDVKVYGRCGEPCPSNVDCREFIGKHYYFFLSFENSLCMEYTSMSEKKRE